MYNITLSNGIILSNLLLNGNNFVSATEVTGDMFDGNLDRVVINDGEVEEIMHNAELVQIAHYADGWYFILREIPQEELAAMRNEAQVTYTAMMTDTLLPEEDEDDV